MEKMILSVPVIGLIGLLFAVFLRLHVIKQDPGNDRMREIADAIAEGARAFMTAEYRVLIIFVAVLFVVIGFGTRSWTTAVCFLVGSAFSTIAGYLGMSAAIRANCRTANAARTSGMSRALSVAFSGGSVMGMAVVGLDFSVSERFSLLQRMWKCLQASASAPPPSPYSPVWAAESTPRRPMWAPI